MKIKVSIIMPAYNAAVTIEESIQSVIAQTYPHWELLIIDDGSTDTTLKIIKQAADNDIRIRIFLNKNNQGVAASRNEGIKKANGEYIAFLDSDDLWHKDKLKKHLSFIKENNAIISYTATAYIRNGIPSNYVLRAVNKFTRSDLMKRNIISCSSVVVKREVMLRYLFPVHYKKIHEDFVSWQNILTEVEVAYGLDEPLLTYRMSTDTKSSKRITSAIMTFNAYRCVGYNIIISFFLTLRYTKHSMSKRYMIRTGS